MAITTQNLLDNYFDWLRKSSQVNHLDNATDEIITPFVDDINNQISIYVEHLNSGKLRLSDDAHPYTSCDRGTNEAHNRMIRQDFLRACP